MMSRTSSSIRSLALSSRTRTARRGLTTTTSTPASENITQRVGRKPPTHRTPQHDCFDSSVLAIDSTHWQRGASIPTQPRQQRLLWELLTDLGWDGRRRVIHGRGRDGRFLLLRDTNTVRLDGRCQRMTTNLVATRLGCLRASTAEHPAGLYKYHNNKHHTRRVLLSQHATTAAVGDTGGDTGNGTRFKRGFAGAGSR